VKSISEEDLPQRFYVDRLLDPDNHNSGLPLSFILQTKPGDQEAPLSEEAQQRIKEVLMVFIKQDGQGNYYINVPDRFIWVYH